MIEKKSTVENFIGIYDNYIPKNECDNAITFFESMSKVGNTINRQQFEKARTTNKQDEQYFCTSTTVDCWWDETKTIIINFDLALKHYLAHTTASDHFDDLHYTQIKIQKTLLTQGYHEWHIEHGAGFTMEKRAFVFSIYLNDVEEGGETEFLHFSKRIKPKKGRIVIWPAGFPYVHRGNPPISNSKYLMTSWMNVRPC